MEMKPKIELPKEMMFGELARLLPVVKDTSREDRASSILLANFRAVPAFSKAMLGGIGQRIGTQTNVTCYSQVVLVEPSDGKLRPDGLIRIERSGKVWMALIEAKIGGAKLQKDQILSYIELAKQNGIDAIITISNDFAALPTHHPIPFGVRERKGIEIYHWSWLHALTQGLLIQQSDEIQDSTQRFLLDEFLRYFDHETVGVKGFHQMNAEWGQVVKDVADGAILKKNSPGTINTVNAWHQESRDLCLIMSRKLGVLVTEKLARSHVKDQGQRLNDDTDRLVSSFDLSCILEVPDAAATIDVTVNLQRKSITSAMRLDAPADRKTCKPQLTWLLKQLSKTPDELIHIRAWHKNATMPSQATLGAVKEDPQCLVTDGKDKILFSRFEVVMVCDLAGKFSGTKTFIQNLETIIPEFYAQAGQYLRAWVPPPPTSPSTDFDEKPNPQPEMERTFGTELAGKLSHT
jgi:hypothetical protein